MHKDKHGGENVSSMAEGMVHFICPQAPLQGIIVFAAIQLKTKTDIIIIAASQSLLSKFKLNKNGKMK